MKLATVTIKGGTVELHYSEELRYSVYNRNKGCVSHTYWITNRKQADAAFLWEVGYDEWRAAGDAAYCSARDAWLAKHRTLASVGAT